eukprot:TRINITY_DN65646_c0_g1_i1.p2 TRINITY_DN65646_c0_g1~~TRINITY_DN65646_c0_g1_i1.p2  ORF type:complete len:295 (-),score=36.31 TRINITY_DN65646_c0_g1_i1:91-975(-)
MSYKIDLHVHSIASQHAYSTIQEIVQQAKLKNLKAIAITDHGPSAPDAPYRYYFSNMRVIPDIIDGVRIYKGVEANFISEKGELDLEKSDLEKLDIVLAGFHKLTGYGKSEKKRNTKALINAIKTGYVDVVAHMGHPMFVTEYKEVLKVAKEYNTAIELNNSSFTGSRKGGEKNCIEIIQMAKEIGNYISLGSDSHISFDVGRLDVVTNLLKEYSYDTDLVINQSIEFLDDFLKERRIKNFNKQRVKIVSDKIFINNMKFYACLLYTSDAADDTPCVDLGGRRIIKKKKHGKYQ